MKNEQVERCGGNLQEELVELEKLSSRDADKEVYVATHTAGCTAILTIYCC